MDKKKDEIEFYADWHFINATFLDKKYKDDIYPIVLAAVIIKISKPRKPHSVLRSIEKSRKAKKSYGSFSTILEEVTRELENVQSKFKVHLPPEMRKKVKKAESEGKRIVIMLPPGKGAPIYLSNEAQQFIDSKNKKQ